MTRLEALLLMVCAALLALALLGPALALPPHYHQFADQRLWLGIPCAMDVLSNLPFALWGLLGLGLLGRPKAATIAPAQRRLAALFFAGLVLTALGSGTYHWRPDDAGLALDRLGMVFAFAGLLGLACADRISDRAGAGLAAALLLLGPLCVLLAWQQGNMLGWAVLQGGAMILLLALSCMAPLPGALGLRLWPVLALYGLAKALELGDQAVFTFTQGIVSGHSLKHVVSSLAAWPVLVALGARLPGLNQRGGGSC